MDIIRIFIVLAGIILLGYIGEIIFKKTKIPDVIFLIFAGIILNQVLGWIKPEDLGSGALVFSTFALVFLLFQGATNLDFKTLFATIRGATGLAIISFILTIIIVTILGMGILGLNFGLALLLGMTVGGVSSTVVIPLVQNLDMGRNNKSVLTLESAVSDVFCIIGAVTIMTVLSTGTVQTAGIVQNIVASFSVAIVIGLLAGLLWMVLLARSKDLASSQMVTVAVLIALYAFIESNFIGASGAIGVLAFGLILGNSKPLLELVWLSNKQEHIEETIVNRNVISGSSKNFYKEISFFVKVFFFVYLGILIDFSQGWIFLGSAVITLGVYLVRPLAVKLSFRKHSLNSRDQTMLEVLIPKGLAAAVIAQSAIQKGVPGAEQLATPVLSIIIVSIAFTSLLVFLSSKFGFAGFGKMYFNLKKKF